MERDFNQYFTVFSRLIYWVCGGLTTTTKGSKPDLGITLRIIIFWIWKGKEKTFYAALLEGGIITIVNCYQLCFTAHADY